MVPTKAAVSKNALGVLQSMEGRRLRNKDNTMTTLICLIRQMALKDGAIF
jgi:hypothetical protein